MIFLKSLLFIAWNVLIGAVLIYKVRWLLFNQKSRFIFGWHIPLTPGFIVSKRDWVFNKVRAILHDFLEQADRVTSNYGYLYKWEKAVYDAVLEKADFVDNWKFLPGSWRLKIRKALAKAARDLASRILRKYIPRLIEQLQVENRIDSFDEQFNSKVLRQYYNRYVHKYLLYFFVGINILIGITNMVLFWIIA